ncbi:MAG: O-antigen ligase family protein [Betaproteobacteria bacterium]
MPSLQWIKFYELTILACLAVTLPAIMRQLAPEVLAERPINVCVLGIFVAAILSHLAYLSGDGFWYARDTFERFGKVILYFLLAVAVLDNESRLERTLTSVLALITLVAALALGHFHGLIDIPALAALDRRELNVESGEYEVIKQLRGTGIFNDPNDLAMILVLGAVIAVHVLTDRSRGSLRLLAIGALAMLVYAVFMTKSRGGALAFFAAAGVLTHNRWGWRRLLYAGVATLPVVLVVFSSRGGGNGDDRFELWSEGIQMIKSAPVFGIGWGMFAEESGGLVAHNSFLHCYSEMGIFGGTFFFGAFVATILALFRLISQQQIALTAESRHRLATVMALVCGAGVSMLTISRPYAVPTYLILGLASSVIVLESERLGSIMWEPPRLPRWDQQFFQRAFTGGIGFLFLTYCLVRFSVR